MLFLSFSVNCSSFFFAKLRTFDPSAYSRNFVPVEIDNDKLFYKRLEYQRVFGQYSEFLDKNESLF